PARRGHQDLRAQAQILHELADASAGLLNPAELACRRELLDIARHVPQHLCPSERLEPAPVLRLRALERRAHVFADVADRRQEVGLIVHVEPRGIDGPDALDILRLERRGDEDAGFLHDGFRGGGLASAARSVTYTVLT